MNTLGAVEQNSNTTTNTVKHQTYVLVMSWSNEYRSLLVLEKAEEKQAHHAMHGPVCMVSHCKLTEDYGNED